MLNIRTIFGETAVRRKMKLRLVTHLARPAPGTRDPTERLPLSELTEEILGVTVSKVIIPVAAGRNLAVLVEAAVRNFVLNQRGIDSTREFIARSLPRYTLARVTERRAHPLHIRSPASRAASSMVMNTAPSAISLPTRSSNPSIR